MTCVDTYGPPYTGAVERVDMVKLETAGTVVSEASLGAEVNDFIPVSETKGYVIHTKDFKTGRIQPVAIGN